MMTSFQAVTSSLMKLHEWREAFNGQDPGFGFDPYKDDQPHNYAEAYALWGRGYVSLFQLTGQNKFLELAERCADWLGKHPNPGYRGPSWGLPWAWSAWNAPSTLSYLITTVLAGELFLALYEVTKSEPFLAEAENVGAWIEDENGGVRTKRGLRLYYANYPPLRFPVVNPTAKASGYFAWLHCITGNEHYRRLSLETIGYVFHEQNRDGGWYYSTRSGRIDNVHTGFTLEGLWSAYKLFKSIERWRRCLWRGTEFYWRSFFSPQGRARERKPYDAKELTRGRFTNWVRDRIMMFGLVGSRIPETRLWGYASAIRLFLSASRAGSQWLERALVVYEYVQRHLSLGDGGYAYRGGDSNVYIRHQAHLFDALAHLARRLQEQSY